ncbi:chemotaxis protein CheD [Halomicrococcus sp. SG-WS-1]|uniref:chemotaxis protein CheD n=1 Tax=Halomicrococcus sp. SG-WS-1 TaxID=3439057 RepID=UPI003F7A456C
MKVYRSDSHERDAPVRVGVADYVVTDTATRLTTTGLGSCLGIALVDTGSSTGGLAHAMLPEAPDDPDDGAKFVDSVVGAMLSELREAGTDADAVVAKIAGGSNMLDLSGVGREIGTRNVAAAREALSDRDVPVVGADTGGSHGRSLELHVDTGTLVVRSAHEGVSRL